MSAFVLRLSLFTFFITAALDFFFKILFLGNPVSLCCTRNLVNVTFLHGFSIAFLGSNLRRISLDLFSL